MESNECNPKDLVGAKKLDLTLTPDTSIIQLGLVHTDGARKYGPYNWRDKPVQAATYVAAARRHLILFLAGEDVADDSGLHHLAHVMGCCSVLLDAQETGNMVDNRPKHQSTIDLLKAANDYTEAVPK